MRSLVVYTSKSGFTKTFAQWIAEDLGAELVHTNQLTAAQLEASDVVLHGGGLRASGVSGLKKFLKYWPILRTKHVVLWHTGANPGRDAAVEEVWQHNLSAEQLDRTQRFYVRGGFDFNRLGTFEKILMRIMKSILQHKKQPTDDDLGMLAMFDNPTRELDREQIKPIVDYVRGLEA